MKKLFFISLMCLMSNVSFGQRYYKQQVSQPRDSKIIFSVDANVPFGDFAKSEYRLAAGADQYKQEGSFDIGFGATIGYQFPITNEMSFRPEVSFFSYNGKHVVGDFDSPKMTLRGARIAGDIVYFMTRSDDEDIYFIATCGLNMEKLEVKRFILKESYSAKRIFAGVGVGYSFGRNKSYFVEGVVGSTVNGDAPCNESFPSMSAVRLSFGFKF